MNLWKSLITNISLTLPLQNMESESWHVMGNYIYNWPSLVTWVVIQKIKKCTVSCTNSHHDVKGLVNQGNVKNTKTWISWERNVTFLRTKNIFNLCLRWHILRSYRFVAEVTFKLIIWSEEFYQSTSFWS